MFTALFAFLMIVVFGKLFLWGIKASWGITKLVCSVVVLPLILIGLVIGGLLVVALPILLVVGAVSLFCLRKPW